MHETLSCEQEKRLHEILNSLTIDEKIDQMLLTFDLCTAHEQIVSGKNPAVFGCALMTDKVSRDILEDTNRYLKKNMRVYIPLLVVGESLHGVMHPNHTVFPQAIGLACSFNDSLLFDVADIIGKEARNIGMRQVFAPNLDLAREPRWGRTEETFGEDPFLIEQMGLAYTRGVQKHGVAVTLKHFVAHGLPESGINISPVHIGEREMREYMLPPFRACIEAGAMSVMPAYSEFDGIPMHASKYLLQDVLRKELGFNGTVFSDFGALEFLTELHHTAANALDAGKQALAAGVDIEAHAPYAYGEQFRAAVKSGEISETRIDQAVYKILALKFRLGLFDEEKPAIPYSKEDAKSINLKAAEESIVLVKNDGILPFKENIKKIALVGPNANEALLGDYTHFATAAPSSITVKDALTEIYGEANIFYSKGCSINTDSDKMLSDAIEAAEKADAVVAVMGDSSSFYGGIGWGGSDGDGAITCGEGFDVSDLRLPLAQRKFLQTLKSIGKPIVLIISSGRPYCVTEENDWTNAILYSWYPGESGGTAIGNILSGKTNPSGKLCISVPRSTGHIPCFYNHKPSARGVYHRPGTADSPGRDYVFDSPDPLYPFGYGLSYTNFSYSDLTAKLTDSAVLLSVRLQNCGSKDGAESILVFKHSPACPVTQPVKQLCAFKKIFLHAGESSAVSFALKKERFTYVAEDMKEKRLNGVYRFSVGDQSCEIRI